jgi:hypothetical protein
MAERLGRADTDKLARAQRDELREPLDAAPETAELFDAEEFVRRTAAREGRAPEQASHG